MRSEDFGKLLLRLMVGGLMLLHGIAKIRNGIDFVGGMLTSHGLPDALRWGVYVGEVVAPALIIIGFLTRPAAIIMVINMGMAIYLARMGAVGQIEPRGGGWALETEAFFLLGALAIAFLGAGRISLRRGVPKVD